MATIVLSAAGMAIGGSVGGSVLGLSTAVIGRAVGASLGSAIDSRLLGAGSEPVLSFCDCSESCNAVSICCFACSPSATICSTDS